MANPIKETPVLKGKDAERFVKSMNETKGKSVDAKTRERITQNFTKIQSLAKF